MNEKQIYFHLDFKDDENQDLKISIKKMKANNDDSWETDSIGSASDLTQLNYSEPNDSVNLTKPPPKVSTLSKPSHNFKVDVSKLGWNLPTNDLSKAGQLDNISVDSYIVGDDELKAIEREKTLNPVNPNYKQVYEDLMIRISKDKDSPNDNSRELGEKKESSNEPKSQEPVSEESEASK